MSSSIQHMVLSPISLEELEDRVRSIFHECLEAKALRQIPDDLLTPREVEDLLDISHQTRIDWTKQGLLHAYSFGGRKKYYKRSEIFDSLIKIQKR